MGKYRKKPVIVEAVQFKRGQVDVVYDFTEGNLHSVSIPRCLDDVMVGMLDTSTGTHTVIENDYIVKGSQGGLSICKPNTFDQTYKKVEGGAV